MRCIFIDIDGVPNNREFFRTSVGAPDDAIDPAAIERLSRIVRATGAEVVVSSTWRCGKSVDDLTETLRRAGFVGVVRDKTPDFLPDPAAVRGDEIQSWLDDYAQKVSECLSDWAKTKYAVGSFVILDDDSDMVHLSHRLVQTSFATGLLDEHVKKAIAMLMEHRADGRSVARGI